MNQCFSMGCKRIGFAFTEPDDSPNTGDRLLGGYLRHQLRLAPEHRLPVLEFKGGAEFGESFLEWMDTHRPDAVLVTHTEPVMELYRRAGRDFPKRSRLIALVNDKLVHGHPGAHQDPGEVGALAVDMLVGMMHRGETGVPRTAHYVLIPGRWVPGSAAPEETKKRR
jgi:DNA-binding LacI/PurR family transcriptional regulator